MISTDHAPHSDAEKSRGLEKSAFGIVGIETAFQLMYTYFVKTNIISFEKLVDLLSLNARRRFNIPFDNGDYTVWCLDETVTVNPSDFVSKGKATPFENYQLFGKCYLTVCGGKTAYKYK